MPIIVIFSFISFIDMIRLAIDKRAGVGAVRRRLEMPKMNHSGGLKAAESRRKKNN